MGHDTPAGIVCIDEDVIGGGDRRERPPCLPGHPPPRSTATVWGRFRRASRGTRRTRPRCDARGGATSNVPRSHHPHHRHFASGENARRIPIGPTTRPTGIEGNSTTIRDGDDGDEDDDDLLHRHRPMTPSSSGGDPRGVSPSSSSSVMMMMGRRKRPHVWRHRRRNSLIFRPLGTLPSPKERVLSSPPPSSPYRIAPSFRPRHCHRRLLADLCAV